MAVAARGALKKAMNFFINRNMVLFFTAWHEHVVRSHAALRFWLNAAMGSAFRRWVDAVIELAEMREIMEKAVMRLKKRAYTNAWLRWVQYAESAARARMAMAYFVQGRPCQTFPATSSNAF